MGREATCTARHGGRSWKARAKLETEHLELSGERRLKIPLASIRSAVAEKGELVLEHEGGPTVLELGAQADRWALAITKPKGRLDKLGVKPGLVVSVVHLADADFHAELAACGLAARLDELRPESDVIFFGARDAAALAQLPVLKAALKQDGALWVVRPKGRPEITEGQVRAAGLAAGLVDVKVVAFSATHTGEKFVIPLAARQKR